MYRFLVFGVMCGMLIGAETAEAQFRRVGPGGGVSVRAPFVHVEVAPDGRTYVRAPFTSVVTPGLERVRPRYEYPYPAGPITSGPMWNSPSGSFRPLTADEFALGTATTAQRTPTDPAHMEWGELRRYTRDAAARFESELTRVADGPAWMASLRPGTIRDLLAEDANRPPDPAMVEELRTILQSYDALAESGGYPGISQLGGFREMREALVELTLPPLQRQRRMLAAQWVVLRDDLGRFQTGASWQNYLQPPREIINPVSDASGSAETGGGRDMQLVEEMLTRYEQIPGTEDYRAILELASFDQMRQVLTGYRLCLKNSSTDPRLALPQSEPIPPPRPMP